MSLNKITTKEALDKAIAENASAVVVFGAEWSPICKFTKQALEKNISKYSSTYFVWIDIDLAQQLQKEYTIEAIPTAFGYKEKSEVNKFTGPMTLDSQIDSFVKKTL